MATIINNSNTAEESILRVHPPILYIPDPDKSKPIAFAQLYFGIVGRDPKLEENQKKLYVLQENGAAVPVDQPFICSAGGVPKYNGTPAQLAVSGAYSFRADDSQGAQVYKFPRVEGVNLQGFSGVIAEEAQTVDGSPVLTFEVIETTTSSFYISSDDTGTEFKGTYLQKGVDYVTNSPTTLTLLDATLDGTVILGRQMDPTGQIIPVSDNASTLFVFTNILAAKASDLQAGDTITINGGTTANDRLGGNRYVTVFGQPETDDGENFIDLDNGNQIHALINDFKLGRYSEVTNNIESVAGTINIDLNQGNVHKILLSENVGNILFLNLNPEAGLTTTVALKIRQSGGGPYTVTYPVNVQWAGGIAPTMTATGGAVDRYVFVTDDNGVTWNGAVMGQNFS